MNNIHRKGSFTLTTLILAAALTAGCASGPERVDADFGNSVRAMNQAQTLNPVAAAAPDTSAITSTDGQRMENALKSYRESVGQPAAIKEDFNFQVSED